VREHHRRSVLWPVHEDVVTLDGTHIRTVHDCV
jgi:hypothetical protein